MCNFFLRQAINDSWLSMDFIVKNNNNNFHVKTSLTSAERSTVNNSYLVKMSTFEEGGQKIFKIVLWLIVITSLIAF